MYLAVPLALAVLAVNVWILAATSSHRHRSAADVPAAQAAIVLGALVRPDGRPSDMLADRLETALELYRARQVRKILVSGDHGRVAYDEVNAMRRWLQERGVSPRDIFMDHAGFDTYDTMVRARKVFCVESAVVVTQAFHLPRGVYLARSVGIDASGLVADRRGYRSIVQCHVRESLARVKAFAEVARKSSPKYLGPVIPIETDGWATSDECACLADGPLPAARAVP